MLLLPITRTAVIVLVALALLAPAAQAQSLIPESAITVPTGIPYDATTILRLATIRTELIAKGVPELYFAGLLADPRATIYPRPATSTAPTPKIDWSLIRRNMMQSASLASGKAFIATHRNAFTTAEQKYGVSKESITAVMRIETNLGLFTGTTPVFNVFLTGLAHGSESRWRWSGNNLSSLVAYCYQRNIDCLGLKGSYAGAFGLPQFLPLSVALWGVDGNGDGVVDLFNPDDAIPSTGNFLKEHGWGKTTKSRAAALARYYGSSIGYPDITLTYGETLK